MRIRYLDPDYTSDVPSALCCLWNSKLGPCPRVATLEQVRQCGQFHPLITKGVPRDAGEYILSQTGDKEWRGAVVIEMI